MPQHEVIWYNVDPSYENILDRTPAIFQDPPSKLLLNDFTFFVNHLRLIPYILLPLPPVGVDITWRGLLCQVVMVIISLVLTALCIVSFAFGIPAPTISSIVTWTYLEIVFYLQEVPNPIASDNRGVDILPYSHREEWFFVNGVATTPGGTQLVINAFAKIFRRRINGICNYSQGLWFDLIECILQRDLLLTTRDIRSGYDIVKRAVADDSKGRVVIIAHSQGGILLTAWVDQLLNDFPPAKLRKIEIYTFATAANHFSSPQTMNNPHLFNNVEHFANTDDFVARFGILSFIPPNDKSSGITLPGRFGGRVFKRIGATGHLLLSHYFDILHPENSFLNIPVVKENSRLASYMDGGNPILG